VFPLAYWRWRVTRILEDTHLVPTQMAAASALLAQIDEAMESTQPLARAG
jgi:hypothetical protein